MRVSHGLLRNCAKTAYTRYIKDEHEVIREVCNFFDKTHSTDSHEYLLSFFTHKLWYYVKYTAVQK